MGCRPIDATSHLQNANPLSHRLHVYFPLSKFYNQKLESIQITAARLALSLRKITPTNIILTEAKFPPLNLRAKYLGLKHLTDASSAAKYFLLSIIRNDQKTVATIPKQQLRTRITLLEDIAIQTANHLSITLAPSNAGASLLARPAALDIQIG